jgi:hypothetical protein
MKNFFPDSWRLNDASGIFAAITHMKTISALPFVLAVVSLSGVSLRADPQLSSWSTAYSAKYARIYTSDANKLAGVTATTWTNGSETQSLPSYTGVQLITYSDSWIYLTTSNLGAYTMGPWYNDAAHTTAFVNLPVNQHAVYRIPRTSTLPAPPATKSATSLGVIGYTVDGVSLFDPTDGYSYVNGADTMGSSGQWHRDAYVNEGVTFDPGNSHQQNTGVYHNHADPLALRYLLGDHVTFNSSTKTYSESTDTPTQHSPILGWAADGYPIYGPYGYSSSLDATSGIRRMVGGFVKRDGATSGVDNINYTGAIRALPAWALRNNGNVSEAGPNVSSSYPFGRYCEDWAYLGDLIKSGTTYYQQGVDFDLNEYNVRYCVTPEFPSGTYAYFMSITSNGTPNFPYNLNRYFFGSPTGGAVAATETVTTYFDGGPNIQEVARMDNVASDTGNVTLSWSSVEGGTYKVEASPDLSTWSTLTSTQAAASDDVRTSYVEDGAATTADARFYRVTRTALASYDEGSSSGGAGSGSSGISSISPTSGTHGTSVPATITLNSAANPTPPPNNVLPTSVTLTRSGATTITATGVTRNGSTGVISATFPIPAGATTGSYTINAVFGPNTWSLTNGFTVN